MGYAAKFDALCNAMRDQDFGPVFNGDFDAAMKFVDDYVDKLLAFHTDMISRHINRMSPATDETIAKDKELTEACNLSYSHVVDAIIDMDNLCEVYGVESISGIDPFDPNATMRFVGDYCKELSEQAVKNLRTGES